MSKVSEEKNRSEFNRELAIRDFRSILEIGPLNRPLMAGPNVKYFDLLPTHNLQKKAKDEGLDPSTVPRIDFFDENGDLSQINQCFDAVVSAHVIEHQPDFVKHLQNVSQLLNEEGVYAFIVPDSRFCFDHHISTSSLAAIVRAFREGRTKPDIWNVIEHRALTTHNDPARHWRGDSGEAVVNLKERWDAAEREFVSANSSYIDVHCWQFTPTTLMNTIKGLIELGLTDFRIEQIYETPKDDLEFCAILKK